MKHLIANIGVNMVAVVCVIIGGYMAIHGKDGWGWFLFIGFLCAGSASMKL